MSIPENEISRVRMDQAVERLVKSEVHMEGHEKLCAQRYADILEKITQIRADLVNFSKLGFFLVLILFAMEFGRQAFPLIMNALLKP